MIAADWRTLTARALFFQNTKPKASAPASIAILASSTFVIPQTFTTTPPP